MSGSIFNLPPYAEIKKTSELLLASLPLQWESNPGRLHSKLVRYPLLHHPSACQNKGLSIFGQKKKGLFSGYVEMGENLTDAAVREVFEETGVRTEFDFLIAFR